MNLKKFLQPLVSIFLLFVANVPVAANAQVFQESNIRLFVEDKETVFKSGRIQVGDMSYHYLAKGDSSRPLMLFLHGFPEIAAAWKDQLKYFSKNFYAVAIDMKGANLTSIPAPTDKFANYSPAQLAAEVNTIGLQLSSGKPFFLVGHDWGATTAWNVGFSFPQSLRGLVIINGAHSLLYFREYFRRDDSLQFDQAQYIRNILDGTDTADFYLKNDFFELRHVLFNNPIGNAKRFFSNQMQQLYRNYWMTPGSVDAGLNYYRAINFKALEPLYAVGAPPIHENESPFLKKYHLKDGVKVLVLWGQKDIYISPWVNDGLEKFFNNASDLTVKRFDKYSHWIVHENSRLVTKEIADFVRNK